MRNFVITIPIDENVVSLIHEMAYRLYVKSQIVSEALIENDPDTLFGVFDGMDDPDLGIEYGYGLEITADKPIAGQRVGDRIEIPQLEVMG